MISKKEIQATIKAYKPLIENDFIQEGDSLPSICLTFATNAHMDQWTVQSGDNSFSGPAYCLPHWAVIWVYRRSNSKDLAKEVFDQWNELIGY